jgi:hypothetical protein
MVAPFVLSVTLIGPLLYLPRVTNRVKYNLIAGLIIMSLYGLARLIMWLI